MFKDKNLKIENRVAHQRISNGMSFNACHLLIHNQAKAIVKA